ncbi:hypothetical protein GF324_10880 [bacterium]|nr:hypothetical protein [bacterium]
MELNTLKRHMGTVGRLIPALAIAAFFIGCGEPEDPSIPVEEEPEYELLGQAGTWLIAYDLQFNGDTAFVAQDLAGIMKFDVADPSSPMLLDTVGIVDAEVPQAVRQIRFLLNGWSRVILGFNDGGPVNQFDYPSFESLNSPSATGIQRGLFVYTFMDSVVSSYDQQLHEAQVIQIVTADSDDGINRYIWHRDSVEFQGETLPNDRYNVEYQIPVLKFNGESPDGLGKLPDPSFVAAGIGAWGVAIADVSTEGGVLGEWVGHVDTPGEAGSSVFQDSYLYVADGEKGFAIVDLADYTAPEYVRSVQEEGMEHVDVMAVQGHRLVVADQFDGLFFYDLTEPDNPLLMDHHPLRNTRAIVFKEDTIIGVTADYEGLLMFELKY